VQLLYIHFAVVILAWSSNGRALHECVFLTQGLPDMPVAQYWQAGVCCRCSATSYDVMMVLLLLLQLQGSAEPSPLAPF
jgi:hypothetical protein